MCCNCCSVRQQKIWVFTLGGIVTVIGIVLIAAGPLIVDSIIDSALVLSPNSVLFNRWVVTPVPLYLSFHTFNWTNPHQVSNRSEKPHFEELGPYTFREVKQKEDLTWNKKESTVTYYGRRTWVFEPSLSNGTVDDVIFTPNFGTVTAARYVKKYPKVLRKIVNFAVNREGGALTMNHTVSEWFFDGFYDHFFDFVMKLQSPLLPLPFNTTALYYNYNNSKEAEGAFTIHTGQGDLKQMGDLKAWKGVNHTGYWEGECGRINGSTGELWSPHKSWHDPVSLFIPESSRFINIFPQENITYKDIKARLYTVTNQTFDNGYIAPDTKCFCVKNKECPKNGVIDFSRRFFNAPVYISHPHFLLADDSYRENTTGMSPDPAEHLTYVILEPRLGIPLEIMGRVQANILVSQDDYIDYLKDVAYDFYAPLFTFQMKAVLTDDYLRLIRLLNNLPSIAQYIGIALTVVGLVIIIVGIWLTKAHKWHGDSPKEMKPTSNVERF